MQAFAETANVDHPSTLPTTRQDDNSSPSSPLGPKPFLKYTLALNKVIQKVRIIGLFGDIEQENLRRTAMVDSKYRTEGKP